MFQLSDIDEFKHIVVATGRWYLVSSCLLTSAVNFLILLENREGGLYPSNVRGSSISFSLNQMLAYWYSVLSNLMPSCL